MYGICLRTDGDIRRKLLDGFDLQSSIEDICNKDFVSHKISTSREILIKELDTKAIVRYANSNSTFGILPFMKEINIVPDALTYGQYIRAMSAVKCHVSLRDGADILDPFLHLEELGMMWFVHRSLQVTKKNELKI